MLRHIHIVRLQLPMQRPLTQVLWLFESENEIVQMVAPLSFSRNQTEQILYQFIVATNVTSKFQS